MLSKVMSMYDKTHYNIIKIKKKKKSIPLASRNFSENILNQGMGNLFTMEIM